MEQLQPMMDTVKLSDSMKSHFPSIDNSLSDIPLDIAVPVNRDGMLQYYTFKKLPPFKDALIKTILHQTYSFNPDTHKHIRIYLFTEKVTTTVGVESVETLKFFGNLPADDSIYDSDFIVEDADLCHITVDIARQTYEDTKHLITKVTYFNLDLNINNAIKSVLCKSGVLRTNHKHVRVIYLNRCPKEIFPMGDDDSYDVCGTKATPSRDLRNTQYLSDIHNTSADRITNYGADYRTFATTLSSDPVYTLSPTSMEVDVNNSDSQPAMEVDMFTDVKPLPFKLRPSKLVIPPKGLFDIYSEDEDMDIEEIITSKEPAYPYYKELSTRILSFKGSRFDNPAIYAEAGFYYLGDEDQVQCFQCGGALDSWEPEDIPLKEHARMYNDCYYLRNKYDNIDSYREVCEVGWGCQSYKHYRNTRCLQKQRKNFEFNIR